MIELRVTELLVARLCHELVGPIGAIGNGAELLAEDGAEFLADAVSLIGDSARQASRRLQFYRFAYGFDRARGGAGPVPYELAAAFFEGGRIACEWQPGARTLSPDRQKLACNLLLGAAEGLPRGGRLVLAAGAAGPEVEAQGDGGALSPEIRAGLALATPVAELTSRTVHAYFTGLLARELGFVIAVAGAPSGFRVFLNPSSKP